MFLSQETQTYESSHTELRVVLIEREVLLCFLFSQLLALECIKPYVWLWLTRHTQGALAMLMSRVAVEIWNHIPKGNLLHWVLASCKMCRGSSPFPSSHRFQVGLSSNACGLTANQAMSSLKNTSKPVTVCLQSSCLFGMLAIVLNLIPPALLEQPGHWFTHPNMKSSSPGTWAWETWSYLFTQNLRWKFVMWLEWEVMSFKICSNIYGHPSSWLIWLPHRKKLWQGSCLSVL